MNVSVQAVGHTLSPDMHTIELPHQPPDISLACADIPVIILIIALNSFNIAAVVKSPALRKTPTHYLLLNLSCSDILISVSLVANFIGKIVDVYSKVSIGALRLLTLLESAPMKISLSASLYTLILVGIDRCIAVILPFRYKNIWTIRKVLVLIACGWLCFIAMFLGVAMFYVQRLPEAILRSNPHFKEIYPHIIYVIFDLAFAYLALTIIAVIYVILIVVMIRKSAERRKAVGKEEGQGSARRRKQAVAVTRLAFILVAVLFLCYLPYTISSLSFPETKQLHHNVVDRITLNILWSSACWNPVLYAWKMADFRAVYLQMLSSCCRC